MMLVFLLLSFLLTLVNSSEVTLSTLFPILPVEIITNGTVNANFAMPVSLTSTAVIPVQIGSLPLLISSNNAAFNVVIKNISVLTEDYDPKGILIEGSSKILRVNETFSAGEILSPLGTIDGVFNFTCQASGIALITTSVFFLNSEDNTTDSVKFYLTKECSAATNICLLCGDCYSQGSCTCTQGSKGVTCSVGPSSNNVYLQPDSISMMSYNVAGKGIDESPAQISTRLSAIANKLLADNADVIALQEVWNDDDKNNLRIKLIDSHPFIIFKCFLSGVAGKDSGLFLASRFPIKDFEFQKFDTPTLPPGVVLPIPLDTLLALDPDTPYDKGFIVATIDLVGSGIVIVNTQLHDRYGSLPFNAVFEIFREFQMVQINVNVAKHIGTAGESYANNDIGLVIAGDFNIDAASSEFGNINAYLSNSTNTVNAIGLGKTFGFGPNAVPCSAEVSLLLENIGLPTCTVGGTGVITSSMQLDYIFTWNSWKVFLAPASSKVSLGTFDVASGSASPYLSDDATIGVSFGGQLSDHLALMTTINIPRAYDPSLLLMSLAFGLFVVGFIGVIAYQNCCIKHINKIATEEDRKASLFTTISRQTLILLNKNFTLMFRSRRALIIQVLVPFVFVAFLDVLEIALAKNASLGVDHNEIRHRAISPISGVPRCILGKGVSECYTLLYTPENDTVVNTIVNNFMISEGIPAGEVKAFADQTSIDDFIRNNNNATSAAINFEFSGTNFDYSIQYNQTLQYSRGRQLDINQYLVLPVQKALDREILRYVSGNSNIQYEPTTSAFPHPELLAQDIISTAGPAFFFAVLMFNFVIQLGQIVGEKEFLLRQGMEVMGLNFFIYWMTWFLTNTLQNIISGFLLVLAGVVFQLKFFTLNDPALYILVFVLFGIAMVSFACFISVFLGKGRTATSIGFAMYLVGVILQGFVGLLYSDSTDAIYRDLFSLLPFALLGQGVQNLASASTGDGAVGIRWQKRFDNSFFPLNDQYLWYLFDTAFFALLTLLIDGYLTNEDPRVWIRSCFGITGNTVGGGKDLEGGLLTAPEVVAEMDRVVSSRNPEEYAVKINKLAKTYYSYNFGCLPNEQGDFKAVKSLTLGIPNGELLCLLGPNGAGKTTTIKMLTGVHAATGGEAHIFGNDVRSSRGMGNIRKSLGFCPQHDILWPELTAREHLRLFCGFKNIPESFVEAEVNARLEDVQLTDWADVVSGSYSGGMKRRLSVAISLIGSPKIVFLDEPTTGMDPVSRRAVWNLIERVKHGRVVVLTTHSMEEADILGDRIAIMRNGELSTIGSSTFLKNKFGSGFKLTVTFEDHSRTKELYPILSKYLGVPKIVSDEGGIVHVDIGREQREILPSLVLSIEKLRSTLTIKNIEVDISSLQEVFLKIAEEDENIVIEEPIYTETNEENKSLLHNETHLVTSKTPVYSFKNQISALMYKSWLNQKRATKTNCAQLAIPASLILLLFLLQRLVNSIIATQVAGQAVPAIPYPDILAATLFGENKAAWDNCKPLTTFSDLPIDPAGATLKFSISNLAQSTMLGSYGQDATIWNPTGATGILGNITKDKSFQLYDSGKGYFARMAELQGYVDEQRGGIPFVCPSSPVIAPISFAQSPSMDLIEDEIFRLWKQGGNIRGGYAFENMDITNGHFQFNILGNQTISQGKDYPLLLNYITEALLKTMKGSSYSMVLKGLRNFPTPEVVVSFDLISLIGPLLYIYVFQLMFPVIVGGIVYEKENGLREVMKMMGLKQHIYWLVTYFFSFLLYLVATVFLLILAVALGFRFFAVNSTALVLLFFFVWGNTLVAFSFLVSVFFVDSRTATVFGYIYVFAIGILGQNLAQNYFADPTTPAITLFITQCIPQFAFYRGLTELSNGVSFNGPGLDLSDLFNPACYMGTALLYLVVEWAVMMLLAIYLEACLPSALGVKKSPFFPLFWIRDLFCGKPKKNVDTFDNEESPEGEYPDVARERARTYRNTTDALRIYNLNKVYKGTGGNPDKVAVRNLTLSLKSGECFGFLGPNGAGKTTTMNMLCGYFGPTSGTAKIFGHDIRDEMDSIHLMLGVCPQENILWEDLTGREHLSFYGQLKGLAGQELAQAVEYRLAQVDLLTAADKAAGAYSGGMKRRLCVAMALVGNPKVVILDEPSTGLDPKARKDLWNVINKARQSAAVLLTTHSMEEAEILCSRIGIFMDGKLRCIGTSGELKAREGDGYYIHVECADKNNTSVDQYLQSKFNGLELLNQLNGTYNYKIASSKTVLSSILFNLMGNAENATKKDKEIVASIQDWGVQSTTLEQVFVRITQEGTLKENN